MGHDTEKPLRLLHQLLRLPPHLLHAAIGNGGMAAWMFPGDLMLTHPAGPALVRIHNFKNRGTTCSIQRGLINSHTEDIFSSSLVLFAVLPTRPFLVSFYPGVRCVRRLSGWLSVLLSGCPSFIRLSVVAPHSYTTDFTTNRSHGSSIASTYSTTTTKRKISFFRLLAQV